MTQAAWEVLAWAMKAGEVATLEETRQLLGKQGVPYKSVVGVSSLLIRYKVKLKTGRPQHQQTDEAAQAAFKKTSPASVCRIMQVSRSGFYGWRKRPPSDRAQQDELLTQQIRGIHRQSRSIYGAACSRAELCNQDILCDRKRAARLVRLVRFKGEVKYVQTSISNRTF